MRHVTSTLAAFLLVVTVAGCQKATERTDTVAQTTIAPSSAPANTQGTAATTAAAPYDLQFLDTMTRHHTSAIEMAKMAQDRIEQPQLKELAAKIPTDQQKEIDQMKAWRDQWYPGAPTAETMAMPGMSGSMNMDMSHLKSMKSGRAYDLMFIDMMTPHHESAVTMARDALGKAGHEEIKTLARQIIDAQSKEIEQMKTWKAGLKKP